MKTKLFTILVGLILGFSWTAKAEIVVLDFESLSTPGTGYTHIGPTYIEDGFNLEAVPIGGLYYYHSDDENFPGSTALFHMVPGGTCNTMLTHTGGFVFDLLSIDLSERLSESVNVELNLIGTKSDNSTVTASLTLDGVFGLETFTLEIFTDLVAVELTQDFGSYQYDNITLDVIPEPATVLFFGLGLLLLRKQS